MAKILFFIFDFFIFSIFGVLTSAPNRDSIALKQKIVELHLENKETESIPYLERYLELHPTELYYRLIYAKALLYRKDLSTPRLEEDVEVRSNKSRNILANYSKANQIFEESILHLQKVRPRDPNLGKWYYLWAFSAWFSDNKERAILLFRKSVRLDYRLTESYYNIASLYESLGQFKDADIFWKKYERAEKELEEED